MKRKMSLRKIVPILFLAAVMAAVPLFGVACGSSNNDTGNNNNGIVYQHASLKLSYAMVQGQQESQSADKFAELVKEETNGAVTVTVFPNGSLYTYGEDLNAVINGGVDIVWESPYFIRYIMKPYMDPFGGLEDLIVNYEQAREAAADPRILEAEGPLYEAAGMHLLGLFETNIEGVYAARNTEITDITDLNGKKVGTLTPSMSVEEQWLHMQQVPVGGTGEVTAASQGQYDVSATSLSHVLATGLIDYFPNVSIREVYVPMLGLMNLNTWNNLQPELQDLINNTIIPEVQVFAKDLALTELSKNMALMASKADTVHVQTPARTKEIFDTMLADNFGPFMDQYNAFREGPGTQIYDIIMSHRPDNPQLDQDFVDALNFAGIQVPS